MQFLLSRPRRVRNMRAESKTSGIAATQAGFRLVWDIRIPDKRGNVPPDPATRSCDEAQLPSKEASMATFVLVHGAWHGGWCWQKVIPF